MKLKSFSPETTQKIAALMAREVLHTKVFRHALLIALKGNLGSGKTCFVQGFIKGLGYRDKITSPTFLIFRRFGIKSKNFKNVYHVDFYRIKNKKELRVLDFKKILSSSQNIVLVEWADRIKTIIPKKSLWIKFSYGKEENERIIDAALK